MSELEHFARIAGDNPFRIWLEKERNQWIKSLTSATDPVLIHRSQGAVQLIDRQLDLLEKAKNLR